MMHKGDIVAAVAAQSGPEWDTPHGRKVVVAVVDLFFAEVWKALQEDPDHVVTLATVGKFHLYRRAARKARNPRTGGAMLLPERTVVAFRPAPDVEDAVRDVPAPFTDKTQRVRAKAPASKRGGKR